MIEREGLTMEEYKEKIKNIVTSIKNEKGDTKINIIYPPIYYRLKDMLIEKSK